MVIGENKVVKMTQQDGFIFPVEDVFMDMQEPISFSLELLQEVYDGNETLRETIGYLRYKTFMLYL